MWMEGGALKLSVLSPEKIRRTTSRSTKRTRRSSMPSVRPTFSTSPLMVERIGRKFYEIFAFSKNRLEENCLDNTIDSRVACSSANIHGDWFYTGQMP